jgi:hypothetical protein
MPRNEALAPEIIRHCCWYSVVLAGPADPSTVWRSDAADGTFYGWDIGTRLPIETSPVDYRAGYFSEGGLMLSFGWGFVRN